MLGAGLAGAMGVTGLSALERLPGTRPTAASPAAGPGARGPEALQRRLTAGWRFGGRFTDEKATRPDYDDSGFEQVTVPHCATPLSWRDWEPEAWEHEWIYRHRFALPDSFAGTRVFVDFEGVLTGATPWLNGRRLGRHLGGYLPFGHEITGLTRPGENVLAVVVDGRWLDVPPGGHPEGAVTVDYFQPAAIHGHVTLRAVPPAFVSDVFARPADVLDPERRRVDVECTLDPGDARPEAAEVRLELLDGDRVLSSATVTAGPASGTAQVVRGTLGGSGELAGIELWDLDAPKLYRLAATLVSDGEPVHTRRTRIGFREARFETDGFFLNGRRLKLFGVNRHQIHPYAGMAMPDRVQRKDAEILREEFRCTMVRCAHYPQSAAFLDACDELGLLVFEEIPGWQYVGDEDWQELVVRDVTEMIRRDRNRPSVVTWGVRINESANHPDLYTRTHDLARELDPSRQTTGAMLAVHYSTTDFHQDVFSYNDYTHTEEAATLRPPLPGIPYLVTEAVGSLAGPHFYRRTDSQQVQARQAYLHAQVHNQSFADDRYAGLLSWQAFDYDSMNGFVDHNLKCNGIADTFRVPKPGAAIYRAQTDPRREPVIEPAFYWDFGAEPAPSGGPGESAMICSNCERLEVFVGGEHRATVRPDTQGFAHLPYPPFFVDLSLTEEEVRRLPELRIDGHLDGRRVLSRRFASDPAGDTLQVHADDVELLADGSDATRVVFRAVDRHGAPRPYVTGDVRLRIEGPGDLVGEVGDGSFPFGDNGGVGAVWLRTRTGDPGVIRLTASHGRLGEADVAVRAVPHHGAGR